MLVPPQEKYLECIRKILETMRNRAINRMIL